MIVRFGLYWLIGGLFFALPFLRDGHIGWALLAGCILSAVFVPVARHGPRGWLGQFGAIALVLVVVGLVCTLSEGALFVPEIKVDIRTALIGGSVFDAMGAAVLATLAKLLKLTNTVELQVEHRPAPASIVMLALSGLSYVLYYMVFGSIAFQSFTRQFYPHAVEQASAMGVWFWVYQFGRGLLMTAAVFPVIYHLRLPRWQAALAVGLLLWIAGGGAWLLVPGTTFVTAQRYAHIIEIMTQNVALGATAVWLLRPRAGAVSRPFQAASAS